jgi:transposase-like protein
MNCINCGKSDKQYKIGRTSAGSQRYKCALCGCRYTPEKKPRGYTPEIRQIAINLFVGGYRPRQIGSKLEVHHSTVSAWIRVYLEDLPNKSHY